LRGKIGGRQSVAARIVVLGRRCVHFRAGRRRRAGIAARAPACFHVRSEIAADRWTRRWRGNHRSRNRRHRGRNGGRGRRRRRAQCEHRGRRLRPRLRRGPPGRRRLSLDRRCCQWRRRRSRWRRQLHRDGAAGFSAFIQLGRRQMQVRQPLPEHRDVQEHRQRYRYPDRGHRDAVAPVAKFVLHRGFISNRSGWRRRRGTGRNAGADAPVCPSPAVAPARARRDSAALDRSGHGVERWPCG